MSGAKRLAKRSILGTRVSALWQQDGRYYPGAIRALVREETPFSSALYKVIFDNGIETTVSNKDIVGPCFQCGPSGRLKHGQKVFVTLNGREVCGFVEHHDKRSDEVIIGLKQGNNDEFTIHRKVDDIRFMESRKSARLVDQATDYSKLADVQLTESKRRAVSHNIDVPMQHLHKHAPDSFYDELREMDCIHKGLDKDVELMDTNAAALVLSSLSVSPKSPPLSSPIKVILKRDQEMSYVSSSITSSGFDSEHSERDQSPQNFCESIPCACKFHIGNNSLASKSDLLYQSDQPRLMSFHKPMTPVHNDLQDTSTNSFPFQSNPSIPSDHHPEIVSDVNDLTDSPKRSESLLADASTTHNARYNEADEGTVYRCTWRGCSTVCSTANQVERHIRRDHFDQDSDIALSNDDEEFYYEEVSDEDVDYVTESFADMYTSAPQLNIPVSFETVQTIDHDYLKKDDDGGRGCSQVLSPPAGRSFVHCGVLCASIPITIPDGQIKRSLSWQIYNQSSPNVASFSRSTKLPIQERLHQHQSQSPKSHMLSLSPLKLGGPNRRPRSEVRKCRKVYGMDNRDQWCTQCKWKKACTRFLD